MGWNRGLGSSPDNNTVIRGRLYFSPSFAMTKDKVRSRIKWKWKQS
ncbi:hypothetical protein ACFPFV_11315 [Salinicoccus siamensis]